LSHPVNHQLQAGNNLDLKELSGYRLCPMHPRLSEISEGEVSEAISEASAVSEQKPIRRTPQVQEFLRHAQINRESVAALGFFGDQMTL